MPSFVTDIKTESPIVARSLLEQVKLVNKVSAAELLHTWLSASIKSSLLSTATRHAIRDDEVPKDQQCRGLLHNALELAGRHLHSCRVLSIRNPQPATK